MEAATSHKSGELVLQNGRQAGARRALGTPTTFLGRGERCDIRLNVDGVDELHCLLVLGPDGVQLRDLNSQQGTFVNGQRAENVQVRHGDVINVGPFHFRIELPASATQALKKDDSSSEASREALRIQAAAVVAQQAALEEEEARLLQRRQDLKQQEEQLAAHLADKQRQVQLWSDSTKTDRETLRKEKLEQEKRLARLEQELQRARQELGKDHQELDLERQRINKIYQRLRQRWQRQWSAEKEKYQQVAQRLAAEKNLLDVQHSALRAREAAFAQQVTRHDAERDVAIRQLREGREVLAKDQRSWRERRSLERVALKAKERQLDEAQRKFGEARRLLVHEKDAWDRQLGSLQKELHGLNNRIVHQRGSVQEQAEEIARLDAILRERKSLVSQAPTQDTANVETPAEDEVEFIEEPVPANETIDATPAPAKNDDWQQRCAGLDRLASELADQRIHLIEQYKRLAEIQQLWQEHRDQAAAELESLARRLLEQEQSVTERDQQAAVVEELLQRRHQEIQAWRDQLKTREESFEDVHEKQLRALRQHEAILKEQLVGLGELRQRWNRRRLQEVDQLDARRATVQQLEKEAHARRDELFEKGQRVEEEKRILAEQTLALEQYRQEVFIRSKDPAAQRRIERLRRRWLSLNAALIRNAKNEREAAKKDLQTLEARRQDLAGMLSLVMQNETALAEKLTLVEEREAILNAQTAPLRMRESVESQTKTPFDESDAPPLDQAA